MKKVAIFFFFGLCHEATSAFIENRTPARTIRRLKAQTPCGQKGCLGYSDKI